MSAFYFSTLRKLPVDDNDISIYINIYTCIYVPNKVDHYFWIAL